MKNFIKNIEFKLLRAIVFLLTTCWTISSPAASFDCNKAATSIEHQICADPQLSKLDETLNEKYKIARTHSNNREAIKQQQRLWLTSTRDACNDLECLKDAYRARITALTLINDTASTPRSVRRQVTPSSPQSRAVPEPSSKTDKSLFFVFAIAFFALAQWITPKKDRRFKTGYKNNRTIPKAVYILYTLSAAFIFFGIL